ncbi:serine hydrolase [Fulvivirgaceae bacterium BMA12]|uniref:Serine hydrolase n=1 Tax=Agaribacillus aureus TaxID=3051825 RepID=A0ABT8L5T9_9BACT|nr:serine hydrolase [Fulvivirgaceae bacterium BMA12]
MKHHLAFFLTLSVICCNGQDQHITMLSALKQHIGSGVYPNIDAIIVDKQNKVIIEEYFNVFKQDSLHDIRSAFKSVTSILAGIAIDKGLISLNDKVLKYFPEYKVKDKSDDRKTKIKIIDLLKMKTGLNCEEFYGTGPDCEDGMDRSNDWIDFCLNIEMKDEPGVKWSYSSIPPMIMGEIISRASGVTIMEFCEMYLFKPLGIEKYKWTITPQGRGMTAGSFYIKPVDMLKIGRLIRQNGNWQGKQIVSADWIKQSTACDTNIDFSFVKYSRMRNAKYESARYGYYWYRENLQYGKFKTEVLFASGNGGQYIMIFEEYDTVIIFTGSNYNYWKNKLPFEIVLKYLLPMIEYQN